MLFVAVCVVRCGVCDGVWWRAVQYAVVAVWNYDGVVLWWWCCGGGPVLMQDVVWCW